MIKYSLLLLLLISICFSCKNSKKKDIQTEVAKEIREEKRTNNIIEVDFPRKNDMISSPLIIKGKARGQWFFEASFPVELKDENFITIKEHYATAIGNWMTEEFVPFSDTLVFSRPETKNGYLILHKANASSLPEHADSDTIKVSFY